ncbi:MAG: VWA domain-containing protein [Dehalococcoidia bacterium]|nr:VWA domain-containing protein [Dehalococcoidia bacterium]
MAAEVPVISFGAPLALAALLALPLAAALFALERAHSRRADAALGGDESLRRGRSAARRRLRAALLLAALALIAIAAARPRWGSAEQPLSRRGIDVVIALDISRSMTAADLQPSRATAAAAAIHELLSHMEGDRVGLVSFAGNAIARAPLTLDLDVLDQLAAQAQRENALVQPGSDLSQALTVALGLLDTPDRARSQAVVLVSDGEDSNPGALEAALDVARQRGVRIYAAAAGTDRGAAVPVDAAGGTEPSRLDRATLQRIADASGGELRELDRLAGLAVAFARLRQSEFEAAHQPAPVERFQWFLGAALTLLIAHSLVGESGRRMPLRRGRIVLGAGALSAGLLLLACGGDAAARLVRDGNDAYRAGRYEQALDDYRRADEQASGNPVIAYDTGNALHRLERFEDAAVASAAAASSKDPRLAQDATYALGSHAFRRGALPEARDAFVRVLLRDPDDADARYNLELVLRLLNPPLAGDSGDSGDSGSGEGQGRSPSGASPPAGGTPAPTLAGGQGERGGTTPGAVPSAATPAPAGPQPPASTPAQALGAAQLALQGALQEAGDSPTLEQALRILDLVRLVNSLALPDTPQGSGGRLPPR